jgi:hypothetical protein
MIIPGLVRDALAMCRTMRTLVGKVAAATPCLRVNLADWRFAFVSDFKVSM